MDARGERNKRKIRERKARITARSSRYNNATRKTSLAELQSGLHAGVEQLFSGKLSEHDDDNDGDEDHRKSKSMLQTIHDNNSSSRAALEIKRQRQQEMRDTVDGMYVSGKISGVEKLQLEEHIFQNRFHVVERLLRGISANDGKRAADARQRLREATQPVGVSESPDGLNAHWLERDNILKISARPGQSAKLTFMIRNSGSVEWPASAVLVNAGGDLGNLPASAPLHSRGLAVGRVAQCDMQVKAPREIGTYIHYFKCAASPAGSTFGQLLAIEMRVSGLQRADTLRRRRRPQRLELGPTAGKHGADDSLPEEPGTPLTPQECGRQLWLQAKPDSPVVSRRKRLLSKDARQEVSSILPGSKILDKIDTISDDAWLSGGLPGLINPPGRNLHAAAAERMAVARELHSGTARPSPKK